MKSPQVETVPVTVLTGFLGSGKTTLLNHILRSDHGRRIAVIENEFGEIPIDSDLVVSAKEELFELEDGCMCCTVRTDLIRIVDDLTKRTNEFDHIVLETTGLADPAPVAQTFFVEEGIRDRATLNSVITVVDAKNVLRQIEQSRVCLDQIAFADTILLNKCDLATSAELATVEARLRTINALARIHRITRGQVDVDDVLERGSFDLDRALASKPAFLQDEYPFAYAATYDLEAGDYELHVQGDYEDPMGVILVPDTKPMPELEYEVSKAFSGDEVTLVPPQGVLATNAACEIDIQAEGPKSFRLEVPQAGRHVLFTQGTAEDFGITLNRADHRVEPTDAVDYIAGHVHDFSVTSVCVAGAGHVDSERLKSWLHRLLHEKGNDLYRVKGILDDGSPTRLVLHAVHELLELEGDRAWRNDETRTNQVVFIGRELDEEELERGLGACTRSVPVS